MIKITKNEVMYAVGGALLLGLWFTKGKELAAPFLSSLPPFIAFLIYNAFFFAGAYLLLGLLTGKKNHFKWSLVAVMLFIGIDLVSAPYLVTSAGINTNVDYWFVSADAAIASLFSPFVFSGFLSLITYFVVPVLFLFVLPIVVLQPVAIKKLLSR